MTNIFLSEWQRLEKSKSRPSRCRNVVNIEYSALENEVTGADHKKIKSLVESLYAGDVFIVKNAFPKKFMVELKEKATTYFRNHPSSFHKMLEGSPDFHRTIDISTGKNYSFRVCKQSCYFYLWNDDPLKVFDEIYKRWRVVKILMGLPFDAYEKNTPKDGVIDRVQVCRYPPKYGYLEAHSDPYLWQRLFYSGYMTKRGVDYQGGGFYLVDVNDQVLNIEDQIDVGDIGLGYATVVHGVAPVDIEKTLDWNSGDGRWFLSMYSNASDEVAKRHTGVPEKIQLDGVSPPEL